VPRGVIADALTGYDRTLDDHLIVRTLRLPRTEIGVALLVVVAIFLLGVTDLLGYVWFALAGAAAVNVNCAG
jgi:hypothetical protein